MTERLPTSSGSPPSFPPPVDGRIAPRPAVARGSIGGRFGGSLAGRSGLALAIGATLAAGAAGCGPRLTELPCREGFTRAADGHCYPPPTEFTTVDLDAAVANLPACEIRASPFLIDLDSGCALGMCPGDLFEESVATFGSGYTCFTANGDAYCGWEEVGVEGRWDDDDEDGQPDPKAFNQRVHLTRDAVVATSEGLGTDASMSCFIDTLGHPDRMTVIDTVDGLAIEFMDYDDAGMLVYDTVDRNDIFGPDGFVDDLFLYGAL